jgi:prolyl oligopeptidase
MKATVGEVVTEFVHGVKIEDPYRWLEDRGSVETEAWIGAQQQRHDEYFAKIPELDFLSSRVASYLNIESVDQPVRGATRLFYRRRRKGQEQACICMQDPENGREVVLVDPSPFGKFCNVRIHRVSMDGTLLAYELRRGGSDAKAIYIVDSAIRRILPDHLPTGYVRGVVFAPDNSGFFYTQDTDMPEPIHTIRYHRFGETDEDLELFRKSRIGKSRLTLVADSTRLGAFHVYDRADDLAADFYLADFSSGHRWRLVFSRRTLPCSPLLIHGRTYLYSRDEAPNGKVSELKDDGSECRLLVPESEASIRQIAFTKSHIFTSYYVDRTTVVHRWPLAGALPPFGETVDELNAPATIEFLPNLGCDLSSFFYFRESFADSPEIREYREELKEPNGLSINISTDRQNRYRIDGVHFLSYDGTEIPMSLVARRSRSLDD